MNRYPGLRLKPGKEAAVKRRHPWLFSGAVASREGNPEEGDIVEIRSSSGEYLATGHFAKGSICAKLFAFEPAEIDRGFWKKKTEAAFLLRRALGLTESPLTNAYRLVNSEGDGLPGLIIDFYNGVAVLETQSAGMARIKEMIAGILKELYGEQLKAVYDKSDPAPGYLLGSPQTGLIKETGHTFLVDWEQGQKTGFFLDQRSNRMFAQFYARDKKVLNAFCYSGAFSVYALKGGASRVHSVDTSGPALRWAEENIRLNGIDPSLHLLIDADIKQYLVRTNESYEMIILDPPAFAKTHRVSHNALQAYIHINAAAMKKLVPGGLLFTFSCSQAISREMFRSALYTAALEAGRNVQLLHHLSQGPDHPVSIYHPEGEYLKGLILLVK